jgi:hypothetical protein
VYLEHAIQDARITRDGQRRIVSRQMQFIEITPDGQTRAAGYAPYLDFRPLTEAERALLPQIQQPAWMRDEIESKVTAYAVEHIVPTHYGDLRQRKEESVTRTLAAVKDRLTKEIGYWDHRSAQLKEQELAGRSPGRLNSGLARQRADELTARLQKRLADLEQERRLSPLPPVVLGGAMIIPRGLLDRLNGDVSGPPDTFARETARVEMLAMQAVMEAERKLGFEPHDISKEKRGYDIESNVPHSGKLRFIEVKGRVAGAKTVTVTKNEILTGLNKPEDFILALVEIDGDVATAKYVRKPFEREPDFAVTSINYSLVELMVKGEEPS